MVDGSAAGYSKRMLSSLPSNDAPIGNARITRRAARTTALPGTRSGATLHRSPRQRSFAGLAIAGGATLALTALVSASGCSSSAGGSCAADVDCKGNRICQDGECVDAGNGGSSAGPGAANGSQGNGPSTGSSCTTPVAGEVCSPADGCCDGAACIDAGDAGSRCADRCTESSDCKSGCCAAFGADNVCAPVAYCAGTTAICVLSCIDDPGCYTDPIAPETADCTNCVQNAANTAADCATSAVFSDQCQNNSACVSFVNCKIGGSSGCEASYPAGSALATELVLQYCGCGF